MKNLGTAPKKEPVETSEPIKRLRRSVGNFIYQRESKHLLYFGELAEYHTAIALDLAHLFYLRLMRFNEDPSCLYDLETVKIFEGAPLPTIGEALGHVLRQELGEKAETAVQVVEIYPGVGLTLEYLKLMLARGIFGTKENRLFRLSYQGIGLESLQNQFAVLHGNDELSFEYSPFAQNDHSVPPSKDTLRVLFYNHENFIKSNDSSDHLSLEKFFTEKTANKFIAMRITDTKRKIARTTVKGKGVDLLPLGAVLKQCRQSDPFWYVKIIRKYDEGFFLPIENEENGTSLLIAFSSGKPMPLSGFRSVADMLPIPTI